MVPTVVMLPLALLLAPTALRPSPLHRTVGASMAEFMDEAERQDRMDEIRANIEELQPALQTKYEEMFSVPAGPSAGEVKKAMRTEIDSMEAEIAEMESSLKSLSGKALRYSAVGRMRQKSAAASDPMSEEGGNGDWTQKLNEMFNNLLSSDK